MDWIIVLTVAAIVAVIAYGVHLVRDASSAKPVSLMPMGEDDVATVNGVPIERPKFEQMAVYEQDIEAGARAYHEFKASHDMDQPDAEGKLHAALLRRAVAIVRIARSINDAAPALEAYRKTGFMLVSEHETAMQAIAGVQAEIVEIRKEADELRPNWGKNVIEAGVAILREEERRKAQASGASGATAAAAPADGAAAASSSSSSSSTSSSAPTPGKSQEAGGANGASAPSSALAAQQERLQKERLRREEQRFKEQQERDDAAKREQQAAAADKAYAELMGGSSRKRGTSASGDAAAGAGAAAAPSSSSTSASSSSSGVRQRRAH